MVGSVKASLKKSVGLRNLTRTELETILHEIEACINSRPLTFVGDVIHDRSPLTPACFLIGKGNMYEPDKLKDQDLDIKKEDLEERMFVRNLVLDKFWTMWSKDYIRHLPSWKGRGRCSLLKEGDVELIREDNCPRMMWPTGVVQEVFPGKDGFARSCRIRTKTGVFSRPIQRLHHLEIQSAAEDELEKGIDSEVLPVLEDCSLVEHVEEATVAPRSRFGRRIKPVQKLTL